MSKRKGRRQPLTSEIKSVLRAPPDGELEEGASLEQGAERAAGAEVAGDDAAGDTAAGDDVAADALAADALAADDAASAEATERIDAGEPPPDAATRPGDGAAPDSLGEHTGDFDAGSTGQPEAPAEPAGARRRGRRARRGVQGEGLEAPGAPDGEREPFAAPAEHDDPFAAAAVRDEPADDGGADDDADDPEDAGERFAEPINLDEAGDDTEGFLRGLVEALLFTSQKPIDIRDLARSAGIDKPRARELIEQLRQSYEGRGLCIEEVAGGFVMRSSPRYAPYIHRILALKPIRLSRAQLETLAIVAYRQPVTKPEVDDIRGVDSGQVIKGLLERNLLKMLGKKDEPGHPTLYGTTNEFLELLNLQSLKDLPTLREYTELSEESQRKFMEATGETAPNEPITFERPPAAAGDAEGDADEAGTVAASAASTGATDAADETTADAAVAPLGDPADDDVPMPRMQSDVVAIDDSELGDPELIMTAGADEPEGDPEGASPAEADPQQGVGLGEASGDETPDSER